jgi:hypothetical protein
MRCLLLAMLLSIGLRGQSIVEPGSVPRAMARFEPNWDDRDLACSVSPFGPALNFSFRIQAGYVVKVPMNQYFGPRHAWFILMRLTPDGGDRKPVYLATRTRLPDIPKTKVEVEIGGGYLLGEGGYQVHWMLLDDQGRVCRRDWHIEAKLKRSEHKVKVAMGPNTVAAFSLKGTPDAERVRDDRAPFSLTILMHAAPLSPRRTNFRATDRMLLVGSLSALLERLPTRSVRLVVFNLDQQKELYRQDDFSPSSLDQVEQAMNDLELNGVNVKVLEKPKGHIDLLADLLNREMHAEKPSDAVVFFGPPARFGDRVPRAAVEKPALMPRFFYFLYRPIQRRVGSTLPDSINLTVAGLKGKTMTIHSPGEFANAIDELERRAVGQL